MNFIVGSMLYHCNEEIAFRMFVSLVETFDMRDIYEPGLPGLYKQCFIIDTFIEQYIPDLSKHFVIYLLYKNNIEITQYTVRNVCFRLDILFILKHNTYTVHV